MHVAMDRLGLCGLGSAQGQTATGLGAFAVRGLYAATNGEATGVHSDLRAPHVQGSDDGAAD